MELFFYLQLRTFPKAQTSAISTSTYIALKKKKKNSIWMVTVNFQWLPFLMFQPFSLFPAARSVFRHFPLQLLSPQWNFNTTDMLHIYLCTVCYKGALKLKKKNFSFPPLPCTNGILSLQQDTPASSGLSSSLHLYPHLLSPALQLIFSSSSPLSLPYKGPSTNNSLPR